MILSSEAFVMLLAEPFFQTFTKKAPCDTATHTEAICALSCASRAEVDELVHKALAGGGARAQEPMDGRAPHPEVATRRRRRGGR